MFYPPASDATISNPNEQDFGLFGWHTQFRILLFANLALELSSQKVEKSNPHVRSKP